MATELRKVMAGERVRHRNDLGFPDALRYMMRMTFDVVPRGSTISFDAILEYVVKSSAACSDEVVTALLRGASDASDDGSIRDVDVIDIVKAIWNLPEGRPLTKKQKRLRLWAVHKGVVPEGHTIDYDQLDDWLDNLGVFDQ
jgi:hypothetical protein